MTTSNIMTWNEFEEKYGPCLFTKAELANRLGISSATVYNYREAVPAIKSMFYKFGVDIQAPPFLKGNYTEAFPIKNIPEMQRLISAIKESDQLISKSGRTYPESAMTWDELEEKFGICLYNQHEIAARINLSTTALLAYKKESYKVRELFFKIGQDVMHPPRGVKTVKYSDAIPESKLSDLSVLINELREDHHFIVQGRYKKATAKSWDEMVRIHGPMLYDFHEISKALNVNLSTLNLYRTKFKEVAAMFFKIGRQADVLNPLGIGAKSRYSAALPVSRVEELREKIYELQFLHSKKFNPGEIDISDHTVALLCDLTVSELRKKVHDENFFREFVVKEIRSDQNTVHYLFDKSVINKSNYLSLHQCSKQLDISYSTLREYRDAGKISQPEFLKGTNLFNIKEIEQIYQVIKTNNVENRSRGDYIALINKYDLLNHELQSLIGDYLFHREKGYKIEFHGKKYKKALLKRRLPDHKREIALFIYKVILGRQGIEYHTELDIDINTLKQIMILDVSTINRLDMDYFAVGLSKSSISRIYQQYIEPFLTWYLMKQEENLDVDDVEEIKRMAKITRDIKTAMNYVPENNDDENTKDKVFLSRENMIKALNAVRSFYNGDDQVIKVTQFMIGLFLALRPSEMLRLEVSDFWLNESGYLQTDENGYGRLRLPSHKTKQARFPSPTWDGLENERGNLIVPALVEQINFFLKHFLYKHQLEKGMGYLFRPLVTMYDMSTHIKFPSHIANWVREVRDTFQFLTPAQREAFTFYDLRHSSNEIIRSTYITSNLTLNADIKRVAQCHLRHRQGEGDTNDTFYRPNISFANYYKGLEESLNFPLNQADLIQWELDKGYDQVNVLKFETGGKALMVRATTIEKPEESLKDLEDQLRMLEQQPPTGHLELRSWLRNIDALKSKITGIKAL